MAQTPAALTVEAEDFQPQSTPDGWKIVKTGQGNYMVDIIGFNHISGERVLSAPAEAENAVAVANVQIPEAGAYRVWSRFEQPTNTENRFRVEIKQRDRVLGAAVMGEKGAPKHFFGSKTPVAQADPSWGSEGLVEQSFDVKEVQAGAAQIVLTAIGQPQPSADRNVDFLFLTQDLEDSWRENRANRQYPILDAAMAALPPRYFLRLTSPQAQTVRLRYILNRIPWNFAGDTLKLAANEPTAWIPLTRQDVTHFTTLGIQGPANQGLEMRAELATADGDKTLLRAFDWKDDKSHELLISLPPYPRKYPDERVQTVVEQYQEIVSYLRAHPSTVGREPTVPLAWGSLPQIWSRGRAADAAASLYHEIGMRLFVGFAQPNAAALRQQTEIARERFERWNQPLNRSVALGLYRQPPTRANIEKAKSVAEATGVLPYLHRFDYGDEISFAEWLQPLGADEIKSRFAAWQQKHRGKIAFEQPSSTHATAAAAPQLYVDSLKFYVELAIEHVAAQAREVPRAFGEQVLYGANVSLHPFYYPDIAKCVQWFRATAGGQYAANFGRHSEYFWQINQPGPLVNGYIAEHFRAGMRDNPRAQLIQYTMPHSPGNTDRSFRRTAFSHLAHGAKGLDYFGIGINYTFTENYIDFRDKERFAALRDINRAMALIEDILPQSQVVPSKVALILSDSTERWDFAGIAGDRASTKVFGDDYKKTRLAYHQDRVGIYYALVHNSRPPDLLIEEDVQNGRLADYEVAYWVGDCIEPSTLSALQEWVEAGGDLVATAGAFRFDEYRRPLPGGLKLLGLQSAELDAREWFFRSHIELPRLQPLEWTQEMPALALMDKIKVAPQARVLSAFKNGDPAVVQNRAGAGNVTYIATLPGVAYQWGAYQPPPVPSRGPSSHLELSNFNRAAGQIIVQSALDTQPAVEIAGAMIDTRLLASPNGFAVPLANYAADVSTPITLTIYGVANARAVTSAVAGPLKFERKTDGVTFTYRPGIGDVLRIDD